MPSSTGSQRLGCYHRRVTCLHLLRNESNPSNKETNPLSKIQSSKCTGSCFRRTCIFRNEYGYLNEQSYIWEKMQLICENGHRNRSFGCFRTSLNICLQRSGSGLLPTARVISPADCIGIELPWPPKLNR